MTATSRRATWWPISFHRGRSAPAPRRRPSQDRRSAGNGVADLHGHQARRSATARCGAPATTRTAAQMNGTARRNVISSPLARQQQRDDEPKAMIATGNAVGT